MTREPESAEIARRCDRCLRYTYEMIERRRPFSEQVERICRGCEEDAREEASRRRLEDARVDYAIRMYRALP